MRDYWGRSVLFFLFTVAWVAVMVFSMAPAAEVWPVFLAGTAWAAVSIVVIHVFCFCLIWWEER